jgi:hypothetical protein
MDIGEGKVSLDIDTLSLNGLSDISNLLLFILLDSRLCRFHLLIRNPVHLEPPLSMPHLLTISDP